MANYGKKYFNTLVENFCRARNIDIDRVRKMDAEIDKKKLDIRLNQEREEREKVVKEREKVTKEREKVSKEEKYGSLCFLDVAREMSYEKFKHFHDLKVQYANRHGVLKGKDLKQVEFVFIT